MSTLPTWTFALILGSLATTSTSRAATASRHDTFHIDRSTVTLTVRSRPYRMLRWSTPWSRNDAPIDVMIAGPEPTVDIVARPAFGLHFAPGRHVYVTLIAKYYGPGDMLPSEPLHRGEPIAPDVRQASGTATVLLPLGPRHAVAFEVTVLRNGTALVRLADGTHVVSLQGDAGS